MNLVTRLLIALLFLPVVAFAGDSTLRWDAVTGATGYKLYQSVDGGATWATPVDVGNVLTYVMAGHVEDKLILWKVSAYNAQGETVAHWQGAWYDGRKRPPEIAGGLGVK